MTPRPQTARDSPPQAAHPTFRQALRFWIKLGFISFGGPAGQIATLQIELVERRRWIGPERFLHALNYCMLLPGPEAQQLAIYCGWLLHRTWGGIAAGTLFVLPSAVILWALSYIYVRFGSVPGVANFMDGLQPAILAVIAAALLRIGRQTLRHPLHWAIATGAFILLAYGTAPYPAVVLGAAAAGAAWTRFRPPAVTSTRTPAAAQSERSVIDDSVVSGLPAQSWTRVARILGGGVLLWCTPLVIAAAWQGWASPLTQAGLFFSKAALVTFGGAYAVLPYVGQQAVDHYGWLSAGQMIDGLAFAETTPGPLIMVLQFVGFMGGWNHPGTLNPLASATLVAAMTTWVTFVPCFLWIFIGVPSIERLRGHTLLNGALTGVTAAVVGVLFNLGIWFGQPVFLGRDGRIDLFAAVTAVVAFTALHRYKVGLPGVILACGVAGIAIGWF